MCFIHAQEIYMRRLLVVQPYVPKYRVPLFDYLATELLSHGFEFRVAAATPVGEQSARVDAALPDSSAIPLRQNQLRLGQHSINIRHVSPIMRDYRPHLVIVEQAVKNLESWKLLLGQSDQPPLLGLWGQGAPYSQRPHRIALHFRIEMTNRARWFFAYTQDGAAFIGRHGFPQDRITVLRNSTDTAGLRRDLAQLTPVDVDTFRTTHSLVHGKTGLFLGGIDSRKGIDFLIQAVRQIQIDEPDFRLLVAGAGSEVELVRIAQTHGLAMTYLGPLEGTEKALALAACDFLLIPQWVGLVATDALAAGRPVVTTDHYTHAPEFSYLHEGTTRLTSEHEVKAYANLVVKLIRDPDSLESMQTHCYQEGANFSIQSMGANFVEGITNWAERDLPT